MSKMKSGALLCLCLLLVGLLAGCGKGEAGLPALAAYTMGGDSAPALDLQLEKDGGVRLSQQALDADGAEIVAEPDSSAPPEAARQVHTYGELASGGVCAQAYAEGLTAQTQGFSPVDEAGEPAELPDFSAAEGTAILEKESAEAGWRMRITTAWSQTGCVVTVERLEGIVEPESMTVEEAIGFLYDLPPAILGLPGERMSEYNVYHMDGAVMVDDMACIQLQVYHQSTEGTNQLAGIYLLTGDKLHLYRLSEETKTVQELEI